MKNDFAIIGLILLLASPVIAQTQTPIPSQPIFSIDIGMKPWTEFKPDGTIIIEDDKGIILRINADGSLTFTPDKNLGTGLYPQEEVRERLIAVLKKVGKYTNQQLSKGIK